MWLSNFFRSWKHFPTPGTCLPTTNYPKKLLRKKAKKVRRAEDPNPRPPPPPITRARYASVWRPHAFWLLPIILKVGYSCRAARELSNDTKNKKCSLTIFLTSFETDVRLFLWGYTSLRNNSPSCTHSSRVSRPIYARGRQHNSILTLIFRCRGFRPRRVGDAQIPRKRLGAIQTSFLTVILV